MLLHYVLEEVAKNGIFLDAMNYFASHCYSSDKHIVHLNLSRVQTPKTVGSR